MKFKNSRIQPFINRIRLHPDNMSKYRNQINNLKKRLEDKIRDDESHGMKVTKYLLAGSWKKHTILRPTGDHPIDIDLVLYVSGDANIHNDLKQLHDFIVDYLEEIYPQKDILRDVDAEGNTKSIKVRFSGSGLEVDIVPVVPVEEPESYVWQPQRGGGGKYITSVENHLSFFNTVRKSNSSYTAIVRALKWWRNYKELNPKEDEPGLSSFSIELIVAYLDIEKGVETNIEEGIIRFFQFMTGASFPEISFEHAINTIPPYDPPVYIADDTNNENNSAKKMIESKWEEIIEESEDAFDSLNLAQSRNSESATIEEWKRIFGPTFNLN